MGNISTYKYGASDLPALMERINKNSIGMDQYFDKVFNLQQTQSNYPPYNLIEVSSSESLLELALAGFKKEDVKVYTQDGKLFVEGNQQEDKESSQNYVHRGLAQRSFTRAWSLSDETEVRSVKFENGLLAIVLGRIIPDSHKRKEWF
jgi:molecular chaperone IbpA